MRIGAMNHPAHDPVEDLRLFASMGLEFIDLTLEPPGASGEALNRKEFSKVLAGEGMGIVGHTAYYLPIAHPFEPVRQAAIDALRSCLDAFAELGAEWMNVHPDRYAPFHERSFVIEQNLGSLRSLIEHGKQVGVGVMVENVPGEFNSASQLADLLDPLPELGLHLDIGHCNLRMSENTCSELVDRYGSRLAHVHLHDNNGHADLHLPLGAGKLNLVREVGALRRSGYDSTITLEVFSEDRHYLAYSREVLIRLWEELGPDDLTIR